MSDVSRPFPCSGSGGGAGGVGRSVGSLTDVLEAAAKESVRELMTYTQAANRRGHGGGATQPRLGDEVAAGCEASSRGGDAAGGPRRRQFCLASNPRGSSSVLLCLRPVAGTLPTGPLRSTSS